MTLYIPLAYSESEVLGWIETIYLFPSQEKVNSKLDTGARTSSIYATDIQTHHNGGELWVKFKLPAKGGDGGIHFDKPVVRETYIKKHALNSKHRYVVELNFCINGRTHTAEFTLADRGNFQYRVLIGRNVLRGNYLVDSAKTFIAKKTCPQSKG